MTTKTAEMLGIEALTEQLTNVTSKLELSKKAVDDKYAELSQGFGGVKADNEEIKGKVKELTEQYAALSLQSQELAATAKAIKAELDAPGFQNDATLKDADRQKAVELQERIFCAKGGEPEQFRADLDNLVNLADYRSAAMKMARLGGIKTLNEIKTTFTPGETKAFEAASLDTAFFSPELLGITVDCEIECDSMIDLYGSVNVSRSTFRYPHIKDYGAIGSYFCDAVCDAPLGPEGNIEYLNGRTYDFRGVFCFQRKVLEEANFDFLGFMMISAARSYRINRNQALITGDGVLQPKGWLKADCFPKLSTHAPGAFNHVDFRRFLSTAPIEYGNIRAVMHQNTFGYLASATDNTGRFIFGDGDISFSPSKVRDEIRISNCLPDPTENNTLGSAENPFVAGTFIAAAGNWPLAYYAVNKRPMWMEQYIGGSSAWCVKYQFGAEDGGFVACCEAARILTVA